VSFFVLAAYLTADAIQNLVSQARPEQSVAGIAVTGVAIVVMPGLALAKLGTGKSLRNRSLIADAAESAFCAFTSGAALLGLVLNAALGWWWADPAAALVIAGMAAKEGVEVAAGGRLRRSPS
jgi:divalent metal cation (Fe/Co/Zn/Cd) transporter